MDTTVSVETFPASISVVDLDTAKQLIRDGDENALCEEKRNILFYAVQRKSDGEACELARYLLDSTSISTSHTDIYGQTPIFYAAREGHLSCLKLLVDDYDFDVSHVDGEHQTALFYAAREGHVETIDYLVGRSAAIDHVDRNGDTPLFYAARDGREEAVRHMLELGASCTYRNKRKYYASYYARVQGHRRLANELDAARKARAAAPPLRRSVRVAQTPPSFDSDEDERPARRGARRSTTRRRKRKLDSEDEPPVAAAPKRNRSRRVSIQPVEAVQKIEEPEPTQEEPPPLTEIHADDDQCPPSETVETELQTRSLYCLQFETQSKEWTYVTPYKIQEFEVCFPEIAVWDSGAVLSTTALTDDPYRARWHGLASDLMRHLVEDVENSKFFREPVDPIKWKIPDYFEIVKDPMDFGTIRTKLDVGVEYRCVSDFINDLEQVFTNCVLYNRADSEVGQICQQVREEAHEFGKKIGLQVFIEEEALERAESEKEMRSREGKAPATEVTAPSDLGTVSTSASGGESPNNGAGDVLVQSEWPESEAVLTSLPQEQPDASLLAM